MKKASTSAASSSTPSPSKSRVRKRRGGSSKPLCAYMLYFKKERPLLLARYNDGEPQADFDANIKYAMDSGKAKDLSGALFQAASRTIANRWKELSREDRDVFETQAKAARIKYEASRNDDQRAKARQATVATTREDSKKVSDSGSRIIRNDKIHHVPVQQYQNHWQVAPQNPKYGVEQFSTFHKTTPEASHFPSGTSTSTSSPSRLRPVHNQAVHHATQYSSLSSAIAANSVRRQGGSSRGGLLPMTARGMSSIPNIPCVVGSSHSLCVRRMATAAPLPPPRHSTADVDYEEASIEG